jgi:hypothetical protein
MLNIYLHRHLDFPHAWKDVSEIRRESYHTTSRYVLFNPNLYIFVATETVTKMIVGVKGIPNSIFKKRYLAT